MPNDRLAPAIALGLLIPIAAGALAQAPVGPSGIPGQGGVPIPGIPKDEPATDAEKTLDDSIARVKKFASFSADVVQAVDMLSQKFEIKGKYLKAPGNRVYLKLAVTGLGDTPATTLQVCDGTTLWDFQQVLDTQSYRKLTITEIFRKLADPVLDAPIRESVIARLGFAGPESMLVGLRKSVRFEMKSDETLDGKKVWLIRGPWKDRAGLFGPNQQAVPATEPLPPYIPSNVAVWIGQEDGWPMKVEMVGNPPSMLRQDSRRMGPDGRPMGAKVTTPKVEPSKITLRYLDLKLDPEIPAETFAFSAPPDARNVADGTEEFTNFLDQAIQSETARKKADSSKGAETLIPGALSVPGPRGGDAAPTNLSPAPAPGQDAAARPR